MIKIAHVKGKVIYESPAPVHSVNIYDIDGERGIYKIGLFMTDVSPEYELTRSGLDRVVVNAILLHRVDEVQAVKPNKYSHGEFARIYVGGKRLYVVQTKNGDKVLTDEKP